VCETKTCSKCGNVKQLIEFGRHAARKDGVDTRCKQCNCDAANAYRSANIELVREKERIRAASLTSEARRSKHQKWRNENRAHVKETGRATMKKLYEKTPEKFRERSKDFHLKNRDSCVLKMTVKRKEVTDSYVATTLKMHVKDLPADLIAIKREQILNTRALRELKQVLEQKHG